MRALCGYDWPTVCAPDLKGRQARRYLLPMRDVRRGNQSEFGCTSGDRFFQRVDGCRDPGHVAIVHDYLHAVATSVRMCVAARFVSLSNGSQDQRCALQTQLVIERVA